MQMSTLNNEGVSSSSFTKSTVMIELSSSAKAAIGVSSISEKGDASIEVPQGAYVNEEVYVDFRREIQVFGTDTLFASKDTLYATLQVRFHGHLVHYTTGFVNYGILIDYQRDFIIATPTRKSSSGVSSSQPNPRRCSSLG